MFNYLKNAKRQATFWSRTGRFVVLTFFFKTELFMFIALVRWRCEVWRILYSMYVLNDGLLFLEKKTIRLYGHRSYDATFPFHPWFSYGLMRIPSFLPCCFYIAPCSVCQFGYLHCPPGFVYFFGWLFFFFMISSSLTFCRRSMRLSVLVDVSQSLVILFVSLWVEMWSAEYASALLIVLSSKLFHQNMKVHFCC